MDDLDDVPDLDDMSDMVAGIKLNQQEKQRQSVPASTVRESNSNAQKNATSMPKSGPSPQESNSTSTKKTKCEITKPGKQFGGMKKGFLFGNTSVKPKPSQNKSPAKSKNSGDIISPTNTKQSSLMLDEVQEVMKNDVLADKSWLTEDLLTKVSSNDKLSRQLTDPHIAKAVSWMQKDPKAAMEYYKNDMEVQTFFKEFYGILGNHFTNLSSKQDASNQLDPEDEKAMQRILSDSTIKEILSKPDIQRLIQELRTDPDRAQRTLNASSGAFRDDVNKLVSAGVLAFQSN